MGVTKEQAVQNRELILAAAERLFREKGVDAVGLAELMKEAGFTQGGFYNHFASKEALVSQVIGKAMDEGRQQLGAAIAQSRKRGADPLIRQIRWYLSPTHRDDIDCGCPIAGFAGEIPHLSKAAQASYDEGLEHMPGGGISLARWFWRAVTSALLAVALACQRRFNSFFLARLQIESVPLDFLDDVLLQDLTLEAPERVLKGFACNFSARMVNSAESSPEATLSVIQAGSLVAPAWTLATMSYLSVLSQAGPLTW